MFKKLALAFVLILSVNTYLGASTHFVDTTPQLLGDMGLRHRTIITNLSNTPRPKLLKIVKELALELAEAESNMHAMQLDYIRKTGVEVVLKDFPGMKHVFSLQANNPNCATFFMTHDIDQFVKSLSKETVENQRISDFQLRYMIYRMSTTIFHRKILLICSILAKDRDIDFFNYMEDAYTSQNLPTLDVLYCSTARVRYLHSLSTQHSPALRVEESPFFEELKTQAHNEMLMFININEPAMSDLLSNKQELAKLFYITGLCAFEASTHYIFTCLFHDHWLEIYNSQKTTESEKKKPSGKKDKNADTAVALELFESIAAPLKAKVFEIEALLRQDGKSDEVINNFIKSLYDNVLQSHVLASRITSKEILEKNEKLEELCKKQKAELQQVNARLNKAEQSLQKKQNVTSETEKQVKAKETRIERLEKRLETQNAETTRLKDEIKQLNQTNDEESKKLATAHSELSKKEKELANSKEKQAKLFEQKEKVIEDKNLLAAKLVTARAELKPLESELANQKSERSNLLRQLDLMKSENEGLIVEDQNNKKLIESLNERLFSATQENESIRMQINKATEQAYTNGVQAAYVRMQAQERAKNANNEETLFIPEQFE